MTADGMQPSGSVPVPDPTKLTTDAVNAATGQWRRDLAAAVDKIEVRLSAMDAATTLAAEGLKGIPDAIKEQVGHLREVNDVRFDSIALQFTERDERSAQLAKTQAEALEAALRAAKELNAAQGEAGKEANAKTEVTFGQQIKAVEDKIEVINRRLDTGQGSSEGTASQRTERRLDLGAVVAVISVIVAVLAFVLYALKK